MKWNMENVGKLLVGGLVLSVGMPALAKLAGNLGAWSTKAIPLVNDLVNAIPGVTYDVSFATLLGSAAAYFIVRQIPWFEKMR